jgi:hypothetical protein
MMLALIDSRELSEWMAYERVAGPLGPERDNLHAGLVTAAIYNVNRDRGRKAFRPQDFLFEFTSSEQTHEQTPGGIYGMFRMWADAARRKLRPPTGSDEGMKP